MQQAIAFDCDLFGSHAVYTVEIPVRCTGSIEPTRLTSALRAAALRHDAFRLRLVPADRGPTEAWAQLLAEAVDPSWPCSQVSPRDGQPVDPGGGPPLQIHLDSVTPTEAEFRIRFHHVAADRASIEILMEDFVDLYTGASMRPSGDYGAALATLLAAGDAARSRSNTADQRSVRPTRRSPALHLAVPPRSPTHTGTPHTRIARASTALEGSACQALSTRAGTTRQSLVLAAYATILARLGHSDDVAVGVPVSLREVLEEPRTAGCFMTVLPVSIRVRPGDDLLTLGSALGRAVAEMYEHRWTSLLGTGEPDRRGESDGAAAPYQTVFAWAERAVIQRNGLRVAMDRPLPYPARLELSLLAEATPEALLLDLDYDPERIDSGFAHALLDGVRTVLESACAAPRRPVHAISLVDPPAAAQAAPPAPDVVTEIEARMDSAGDRIAVLEPGGQSHTYAALRLASDRIAQWAAALPADQRVVGLAIPRSFAMVAALVGALRARCTMVLLDPDDPQMIASAARAIGLSRVLVGDGPTPRGLDPALAIESIPVARLLARPHDARTTVAHPADEPAVVVLTSGTTGVAKPVRLTRAGLSAHVAWVRSQFRLSDTDRVLQFCSVAFDAMLEEVLPALAAGAQLVLADRFGAASGLALAELCAEHGVTVADLPTGFFNLAAQEWAASGQPLPACLRLVVIGGEAYTPAALAAWRRLRAAPALLTTYGPAEATVVIAAADLSDRDDRTAGLPLVGDPRPGCTLHVLDRWMQPCPDGVVGELYAGGISLAAGYVGAPAATAGSFVPDPFAGQPGARLYRTGDRAVRDATGALFYVGRVDRQIKVRGVRVEPGGIESVFSAAFDGAPCAVVAAERGMKGAVQLVAFLQAEARADTDARLERARAALPPAARPALIQLAALPLTARGKVDRAALRARAEALLAERGPASRAPHLDLVAQAIGVGAIEADDDFFALGGHSLAVLRLIALARDTLGARLDVRDIYRARTAGAIAALIAGAPRSVADEDSHQDRFSDPARLSPFEVAVYVDDQLIEGESPYLIRETWTLDQPLDRDRLRRAVAFVLARHPILRAQVVLRDDVLCWWTRSVEDALADVMPANAGAAVATAGPRVGLRISLRGDDAQQLEIVAHHAVLDGRGLARLIAELARAYTDDTPPDAVETCLPPALSGGDAGLAAAWRDYLAGIGRPPRLEPDVVATNDTSAAVHARALTGLTAPDLAALGHGQVAIAAAMVAAWLHRMTGADHVVLFVAAASDVDTAGLRVCTTILPLRSGPARRATFSACVDQLAGALVWALDHRHIGLHDLAHILRDEAGGHVRLPVLLDVQDHRAPASADFGGVRAMPVAVEPGTVRADLEITVHIERDLRIAFSLRGRRSLYTPDALAAWAESLALMAETLVATPTTRLATAPLIRADSRFAAVRRGDRGEPVAPLPELLWRALDRRREVVVAISATESTTGSEALGLADATARRIAGLGVSTGDPVYCELERSLHYASVVLGIWRAGAVPVLVNPAHPRSRRQIMRSQLPGAATIGHTGAGSVAGEPFVALEELRAASRGTAHVEPRSPAKVAYVAFTSGSTGAPKPVACTWSGLSHLLGWSRRHVPMGPDDTLLHTAAPGFDIALWEMLHPLTSGALLVVAPADGVGDPACLIALCEAHRCTHVHFVPGLLAAFLDALRPHEGQSLKLVLCGGDATPASLHRRLLDSRRVPMRHCYGPTEATIFVLSWLGDRPSPWPDRLPLGEPVDGTGVAVVDAAGAPVVRGVVGELALFGESLALGNLGMGGATAARFRPRPGAKGQRVYLTGDRARMLPDGALEYRGRDDRQVKVAGIRVELGEVEAALAAAPEVARAVVVHRRVDERDRLIAYVTAAAFAGDHAVVARAAEKAAQARLPATLVPRHVVVLDALPLTLSGKVDVAALPEPGAGDEAAPGDDAVVSGALAESWQEALGDSRVGPDDDFFVRGGDSMAAIRLVAAARRRGVHVRLADVFRNPTLRRLSDALAARGAAPVELHVAPGTRVTLGGVAQRWLDAHDPVHGAVVPAMLLRAPQPLERDRLGRAWLAVLRRRDALCLVVRRAQERSYVVTGAPPDAVVVPVADHPDAALRAAQQAIDPGEGVLASVAVVAGEPDLVAVAMHHLAADWQSWALVLGDLWDAYAAEGSALGAAPAPLFASWARGRAGDPGPVLLRRADAPRRVARRTLDEAAGAAIASAGVQRTALLLAAAGAAIAQVLDRAQVVIDLEVDGRDADRAADVVGWLADYRPVSLAPTERDPGSWLAAAERALAMDAQQPDAADCVLNIVPGRSAYTGPFVPVGQRDDDMAPVHSVAIEVELGERDHGTLSVDCDDRYPAGSADALAEAIAQALARAAGAPRRVRATPLQQAMVLEHLRRPGDGLYHTQIIFELEGQVDLELLREAWTWAARAHDAFRCRIAPYAGDGPELIVDPHVALRWAVRSSDDRVAACQEALQSDLAEPFDLAQGPLSRLIVVRDEHGARLIWSHHHVLFDGWSLNLVVRTVAHAYAALQRGQPLAAQAPSLAAFAHWWAARDLDRSVAHWVDTLAGAARPAQLAGGRRQPDGPGGGTIRLALASAATRRLEALGAAHGATLHEIVLAAWALVLARQSQTPDVTFGIVVALRPPEIPDAAATVGLLMNTVPFHVALGRDLAGLLSRTRAALADAMDHADAPLARVVAGLRAQGREFGLDSVVVFENYPGDSSGARLGDAGRLTVIDARERSETPLVLVALPGDELRFELLHGAGPDLDRTATRLGAQLERVLHKLVTSAAPGPDHG
jgi:nocardicin nonribosomal peptide synthetase NocA